MRVALITDIPSWYSETNYLNELEKKMKETGIISKVFVVGASKTFKKIDTSTGIIRFINTIKLLKSLSDYDMFHIHFTYLASGFLFLRSLGLLNKPIIIHTHGYDVFTVPSINYGFRTKLIGQIFTNYAWKRADRIIAVCNKAKLEIEKAGIKSEKIDLLYNGINEKLFLKNLTEVPKDLSEIRENSDLIFLSVASIFPVKNHVRMLNAFEKLAKKYSSKLKIKLVLIGPQGSSPFKFENPDVIYIGKKNHSELSKFYSFADAFVLPSLSEANSWAILEAMSCELPVIVSDVGGNPDVVEDSRFRFNPLDIQDILDKFALIVEMSPEERKIIGTANRQKILNGFTIEDHTRKLKQIYETFVSS